MKHKQVLAKHIKTMPINSSKFFEKHGFKPGYFQGFSMTSNVY